jgi:hypothetical protein
VELGALVVVRHAAAVGVGGTGNVGRHFEARGHLAGLDGLATAAAGTKAAATTTAAAATAAEANKVERALVIVW